MPLNPAVKRPKMTIQQALKAKPTLGKESKVFDGKGLFLFTSKAGSKIWRLAYKINGKEQTHRIGSADDIDLDLARSKASAARRGLLEGIDPNVAKRAAIGISVEAATRKYWKGRTDISDNYKHNAIRANEMYVFPKLGQRPLASINHQDILDVLNPINAKGLTVYRDRTKMWMSMLFKWGIAQNICTTNPTLIIISRDAFGKRRAVKHHARVSEAEAPALFQRILQNDQTLVSVLGFWWLTHTWVRTQEARYMKFDEVKGDLWHIPGLMPDGKNHRMKMGVDHVVPLTRQALAIWEILKAQRVEGQVYVFPNDDDMLNGAASENFVLYMLERAGYKRIQTGHGLRGLANSWAKSRAMKNRWLFDIIKVCLAHSIGNDTDIAYDDAEYIEDRRTIMQSWSDWVEAQSQPSPASNASTIRLVASA